MSSLRAARKKAELCLTCGAAPETIEFVQIYSEGNEILRTKKTSQCTTCRRKKLKRSKVSVRAESKDNNAMCSSGRCSRYTRIKRYVNAEGLITDTRLLSHCSYCSTQEKKYANNS